MPWGVAQPTTPCQAFVRAVALRRFTIAVIPVDRQLTHQPRVISHFRLLNSIAMPHRAESTRKIVHSFNIHSTIEIARKTEIKSISSNSSRRHLFVV